MIKLFAFAAKLLRDFGFVSSFPVSVGGITDTRGSCNDPSVLVLFAIYDFTSDDA